jgi:nicotinamide-nucleotide amidase
VAEIVSRIALLSTGDELVNGDVLNTNSHQIARQLSDHNIQPGLHISASDDQSQIESAMRFLLMNHAGLIITGGLGPTSDDRTRFALEAVLNTRLVFDEDCWEKVVERLRRFSLPIPDTNRQQCLFPPDAVIFPNHNGTAAGCRVMYGQQPIFMLPGPPFECLPIFESHVLPDLLTQDYAQPLFRCEWLLLGVSEGGIAELLDPLVKNSECYVGYRINHPYLEIKLQSADAEALEKMRRQFEAIIGAQSVSQCKQKASAQLKQYIHENSRVLQIDDRATGGLLATILLDPESCPYLDFTCVPVNADAIHISLRGMDSYWRNQAQSQTLLKLEINTGTFRHSTELMIPFRRERTPAYAAEIASWEILKTLTRLPNYN